MSDKILTNFDRIKESVQLAKQKAEHIKPQLVQNEKEPTPIMGIDETFMIQLVSKPKIEKTVCNYYLSVDLKNRIHKAAQMFGKKDSIFLEEIMDQVLKSLNI